MLLARHIQSVFERFLVGSPHKCDQGLNRQVHVIQLVGLQCSQTGWDFHIFRSAADALQVRDDIRQLFHRCIGCQSRRIIKLTHQIG